MSLNNVLNCQDILGSSSILISIKTRGYVKEQVQFSWFIVLSRLHLKTKPVKFLIAHACKLLGKHLSLQPLQPEQKGGNDILKVDVSFRLGNHDRMLFIVSN